MRYLVVAGTYRQYRKWLHRMKIDPREARFVDGEYFLEGTIDLDLVEIVTTGGAASNPVVNSDRFKELVAEQKRRRHPKSESKKVDQKRPKS